MNFENLKETTVNSKELFRGVVANLFIDEVELPDGSHSTREYLKHNGAVAVIPVDEDGNVYLVNQYRYPFSRVMTEIPAGKLDTPDEDPLEAAKRELREETGFTTNKITFLGEFIGSAAIIGETIYVYLAQDLEAGKQELDRDEFLNVIKMPLDTLVDKIMNGEIADGKTLYAALKVDKMFNEKQS